MSLVKCNVISTLPAFGGQDEKDSGLRTPGAPTNICETGEPLKERPYF